MIGAPQAPRPSVEVEAVARRLVGEGFDRLRREDPVEALDVFRRAAAHAPEDSEVLVGLGRSHLLLGRPEVALAYGRAVLAESPGHDAGQALVIRALMRGRHFREALEESTRATRGECGIETLAAHASALFRTQNNGRAAEVYREVLERDPLHAEAHLRLGSGLTSPRVVGIGPNVERGVRALAGGRFDVAIEAYRRALEADEGNPVVHRLIGEARFQQLATESMAAKSDEFRWLASVLPDPNLDGVPLDKFMPAFDGLPIVQRKAAARSVGLFWTRIGRLVAMGGRHDLMSAVERTTDHPSRRSLRGRRTFDGRVWDDVRGIGGLQAATGIEALDEVIGHGFDTLAHEIAHQAHLYGFPHRVRAKVRAFYKEALEHNRCLDFYAASNDAEYFGQGVEAFASLGKRPGYEVTHGHTRFELMRVDPKLYALIESLVDFDPLSPARTSTAERVELLRAAIAVALRSGRPADAVTAARMLPEGNQRDALERTAERALRLSRSY